VSARRRLLSSTTRNENGSAFIFSPGQARSTKSRSMQ
jgi:hypothetical protein